MKTLLFKIAHSIKGQFASFSEALKQAWKVIKLRMKLSRGNASFKFVKVDGTIREAVGTLNIQYEAKGTKEKNYSLFNYYDVISEGWRSFKVANLI